MTTTLAPPSSPGIPTETTPVKLKELEELARVSKPLSVLIMGRAHDCHVIRTKEGYLIYWPNGGNHATVNINPGMLRNSPEGYSLIGSYTIHVSDRAPVATSQT